MYEIVRAETLAANVKMFVIAAPLIARKCQPGQFVIVRTDETGERIPLTIADFDRAAGTITIIFQEVGFSTKQLGALPAGSAIRDVVGPLGRPTEIAHFGTVVCIGGGIGVAPVYPIARAYKEAGNRVIAIIGARTAKLLIYVDEMRTVSDALYITTDDGSAGQKGLVIDPLKDLIAKGEKIDRVMAIGPVIMMKSVADTTRPHHIHTIVSLNPIMVDGTGMCGGCRVKVGDENKFACVDGPEFDAHEVDFPLLMSRQRMYIEEERHILECRGECKCQQ